MAGGKRRKKGRGGRNKEEGWDRLEEWGGHNYKRTGEPGGEEE